MNDNVFDCIELYAIPGRRNIIDTIHPVTGLTWYYGLTEAQVVERDPGAVRYTWAAWRDEVAAAQHTPITWERTTRRQYHDMLEVLFPALWIGPAFLVGEPSDHDVATGQPRFSAYRRFGSDDDAASYWVADRPLTAAEFREELGLAPSNQIDYVS